MTTLKAGDVRKAGDQVRCSDANPAGFDCYGQAQQSMFHKPYGTLKHQPRVVLPGPWKPVKLIGHKILTSDLMAAEFRRP